MQNELFIQNIRFCLKTVYYILMNFSILQQPLLNYITLYNLLENTLLLQLFPPLLLSLNLSSVFLDMDRQTRHNHPKFSIREIP